MAAMMRPSRVPRRVRSRASASNPASHSLARKVAREVWIHGQAYLAIRRARRATRGRTVIVGPWSSEVGFELLYWIPFVRQRLRERGITPDRVVVVSRGGVSAWYGDIAARYFDLLDWFPAERLLEERRQRIRVGGGEKQMSITPFDREVVTRVRDEIGDPGARLLHPLTMYRRYRGVWTWRRPPAVVEREVDFSPIAAPPAPPVGLARGRVHRAEGLLQQQLPGDPREPTCTQRVDRSPRRPRPGRATRERGGDRRSRAPRVFESRAGPGRCSAWTAAYQSRPANRDRAWRAPTRGDLWGLFLSGPLHRGPDLRVPLA